MATTQPASQLQAELEARGAAAAGRVGGHQNPQPLTAGLGEAQFQAVRPRPRA
jgi:hypothetical protein